MESRILDGRYELSERIGSGGMGTVWRAKDSLLGRDVAVKLLHDSLASDASFAERFRREARNAARLAHPNIVTVYDTGEHEATPYIVMELVDGESLHARIHRAGPLSVADAVHVTRAVLAALAHAHTRGLVHRDMKPANVLIAASGEVKVVDFGIAKGIEEGTSVTRTGALMGTAAYLSPEQVEGRPATAQSDLYALGCLMYAALCGSPPYEADTAVAVAMKHLHDPVPSVRARRPDVPATLEAVITQALEKDPPRRFQTAAQMDVALRGISPRSLPDTAPTVVMPAAEATVVQQGTEVIATQGKGRARGGRPYAPRSGRVLGALAALMLVGAAVWLLVAYMSNRNPGSLNAPLPSDQTSQSPVTQAPTTAPTPSATPPPVATAAPTPLQLPGLKLGAPEQTASSTPEPTTAEPSGLPSPTL
jgi:serine/threonine-protein kinase